MLLKQWLSHAGETYESFSKKLNVSVPYLCNIMSGKQSDVKASLLLKLVSLTGLDITELAEELSKRHGDFRVREAQLIEDRDKEILP